MTTTERKEIEAIMNTLTSDELRTFRDILAMRKSDPEFYAALMNMLENAKDEE